MTDTEELEALIGEENIVDLMEPESTAEQRARYRPDEATTADIEQALEGLPVFNTRRCQMIEHECRRCREKNRKRGYAGVAQRDDEDIADGDPVTVFAMYNTDDAMDKAYWRLTHLYHRRHPHKSLTEHAVADMHIVRAYATARIVDAESVRQDRSGEDIIITDVSIAERSPKGEGELRDPPSDVARRRPTDPIPDWPQETVDWFEQLQADHDLQIESNETEWTLIE